MATVQSPPAEQRMVLHGISWETYERLLADHEQRSAPRFTYDRGELAIMSPLPDHERYNRLVQMLVPVAAGELGIDTYSLGSTTFRRKDIERGFEPDSCFYIENRERVRGKDALDLRVDPSPDLVFEIDITHSSLDKLSIYARFRVPEVWRYDGTDLQIWLLRDSQYTRSARSAALPGIVAAEIAALLGEGRSMSDGAWARGLGGRDSPSG
jgi:Uma2 family endonuclease